jgi:hypothetical protein
VQDLHALFTGEDDTWEAWLVFDTGPKLGSNTIKLRRGFSSSESAKPSQVNHCLIFPSNLSFFSVFQYQKYVVLDNA